MAPAKTKKIPKSRRSTARTLRQTDVCPVQSAPSHQRHFARCHGSGYQLAGLAGGFSSGSVTAASGAGGRPLAVATGWPAGGPSSSSTIGELSWYWASEACWISSSTQPRSGLREKLQYCWKYVGAAALPLTTAPVRTSSTQSRALQPT